MPRGARAAGRAPATRTAAPPSCPLRLAYGSRGRLPRVDVHSAISDGTLRRLVDEGAIGTLRLVRSSFSFSIDPGDWRLDRARGGGALWDIGCYGVSTARLFAGSEPESIRARARARMSGSAR